MLGYWISFSLIASLTPISIFYFIHWLETKLKVEPTKEQKTRAYIKGIYYTAFYWLADLFYMAHFINNLACKFVFGGLMLIIILVNVARSFSVPKTRNGFDRFGLIQDFLVGMALTVYLIYLIPNSTIQSIVIPVVAALYGGFITLIGVAWTIRKTEKDRKDDEVKKARPIFSYNMMRQEPKLNVIIQKICFSDVSLNDTNGCEANVELENSNLSPFEIKSIYHDKAWHEVTGNKVVLPSGKCILNFRFDDEIDRIFMEVEDLLKNKYYYQLKVLWLGGMSKTQRALHTVSEINEIKKEDLDELIKEEPKNE